MDEVDLSGLRVLVVEDESLVAMLIDDVLGELNCVVAGVASNLKDGLDKAATLAFDIAILDVNLNGTAAYPIAELLTARGAPFVFSTGYGAVGVPEAFSAAPVLAKPFDEARMRSALAAAWRGRSGTS
ncbi:MAG TPA: response regulator [Caulobacteraceae bacterium]|jgi:CheY-like chemotaxis protein|nr:response regulator [Caulobacteraceae bacterium]